MGGRKGGCKRWREGTTCEEREWGRTENEREESRRKLNKINDEDVT